MSFRKIHLAIAKGDLKDNTRKFPQELRLDEVKADYDTLQLLIRLVGGKYHWHDRKEYHSESELNRLIGVLHDPQSRLWFFKHGREIVGFCCAAIVEPDLSGRFNMASGRVMEIYKIGLFDEFTGQGWGHFFVPAVIKELFKSFDVIYLNTRDTNHGKVVPFYQSLGMSVIGAETLPDDLLPPGQAYFQASSP